MDEITTIQISVKTKEELSEIGKKSETYDSIVLRLIHEHYNLNIQPYLKKLIDVVDWPVDKDASQMALELFEGILRLGSELSFVLDRDPRAEPLVINRKNLITFYKNKKPLCLVRTAETYIDLLIPTAEEGAIVPGWKHRRTFAKKPQTGSLVEREMEFIKHLYENM